MAIRVVLDQPTRYPLRRVRHRLAAAAGALLVLVGLLAGAVPVLLVVVTLASFVVDSLDTPRPEADLVRTTAVLLAVSVVATLLGLRLARGRRTLVLFLRRFRLLAATEALSYAAAHAVGHRWRVVTLDDAADVTPLGLPGRARRLPGLGVLVALLAVAAALWWLFGGPFERFLGGIETPDAGDGASVGEAVGALIGTVVAVLVVGALVATTVLVAAAFAGMVGLFSWSAHRAALRAERSKTAVIQHVSQVEPYTRLLLRRTRGVLAPRLVVVRATLDVWRHVVHSLAGVCQVVVVDLSDPTESLLWEVETLRELGRPAILVAHAGRVGPLVEAAASAGTVAQRVVRALGDDVEVLAYGQQPAEVRRFARALRTRLEELP